jgi:hypothetical protein
MTNTITILASKKIDSKKWDQCVFNNSNGLIYSTSLYLNTMAKNWHGLVIDDYSAIMPLPWKRKLGIRYGYTPPFIQQLGLIGTIHHDKWPSVLDAIHSFYSYADIHFNFQNVSIQNHVSSIQRTNLMIDLSNGYPGIQSFYSKDLNENIRKAAHLSYQIGSLKESIALYQTQYSKRFPQTQKKDYVNFMQLCLLLVQKKQCFIRSVHDDKNTVLATTVLLKDNKRVYNVMNTTTFEGRNKEANHYLIDQIIREFSGQLLLFDFEGSSLPGVKAFYEKFGAENEPYFQYHFNHLPWPIHLLRS